MSEENPKPWLFTKENAAEMQQRGALAKQLFQTPERRRYIARRAALRRWYRPTADALERVESLLKFFANEVVEGLMRDDHEFAVRCASAMLGWERIKIAITTGNMKDVTPELSKELEGKLAAARERREKALVGESAPVETTATKETT